MNAIKAVSNNATIHWQTGRDGQGEIVARDDHGQKFGPVPWAEPIDASTDSWAVASAIDFGHYEVASVDHDGATIHVTLAN